MGKLCVSSWTTTFALCSLSAHCLTRLSRPRQGYTSGGVTPGGMAEWLMAAVLKTVVPERVSGVRIPLPPPTFAQVPVEGLPTDGGNTIENETRDGRVIDGLYSVRNGCGRDATCTFTIEVGTRLESDVDVGSWRSFRAQRTMTQEHTLKSAQPGAAANVDFRFRGTVDAVPAGGLGAFRVVSAWHDQRA